VPPGSCLLGCDTIGVSRDIYIQHITGQPASSQRSAFRASQVEEVMELSTDADATSPRPLQDLLPADEVQRGNASPGVC